MIISTRITTIGLIVLIYNLFQIEFVVSSQQNDEKILNVPYINQCLVSDKPEDQNESRYFPNLIGSGSYNICKNMCGATSAVMIAAYFKKLPNENDRKLKEFVINDPAIEIVKKDGKSSFGGAFAITSYSEDSINYNASSIEGMVKYLNDKGLMKINSENKNIVGAEWLKGRSLYNRIKIAIDRGNPGIVSSLGHIRTVVGYRNGKIILHDPYLNTSGKSVMKPNYDGKNSEYSVDMITPVSIFDTNYWNYFMEFTDPKPGNIKFVKNQNIVSYKQGIEDPEDGVKTRSFPGGRLLGVIPWKTNGEITEGPIYSSSGWAYKVKWAFKNLSGWVPEQYLKDKNWKPGVSNINKNIESIFPSGANVRKEAATTSEKIGFKPSYLKGVATKYVTENEGYNWYYIKWEDNTEGFSAEVGIYVNNIVNEKVINQKIFKLEKDMYVVNDQSKIRNPRGIQENNIKKIVDKGYKVYAVQESGIVDGFEWLEVKLNYEKKCVKTGWFGYCDKEEFANIGSGETVWIAKQNLTGAFVESEDSLIMKDSEYILSSEDEEEKSIDLNVREAVDAYSRILGTAKWGNKVKVLEKPSISYGQERVKVKIYDRKYCIEPDKLVILGKTIIDYNKCKTEVPLEGWIPSKYLVEIK